MDQMNRVIIEVEGLPEGGYVAHVYTEGQAIGREIYAERLSTLSNRIGARIKDMLKERYGGEQKEVVPDQSEDS